MNTEQYAGKLQLRFKIELGKLNKNGLQELLGCYSSIYTVKLIDLLPQEACKPDNPAYYRIRIEVVDWLREIR